MRGWGQKEGAGESLWAQSQGEGKLFLWALLLKGWHFHHSHPEPRVPLCFWSMPQGSMETQGQVTTYSSTLTPCTA